MEIDILRENKFSWLLEKDKDIYPTDKPVTESVLRNWYARNPEFGIAFREGRKIIGANIIIPLNKQGWKGMIDGRLLESDCWLRGMIEKGRYPLGERIPSEIKLSNMLKILTMDISDLLYSTLVKTFGTTLEQTLVLPPISAQRFTA